MKQLSVKEAAAWLARSLTDEYRFKCLKHWGELYGEHYVKAVEIEITKHKKN